MAKKSTCIRSVCPISCALDLLGDKWTLLVIRDMVFLQKQHFKDFLSSNEGIASNILSDRLRRLEEREVVEKRVDPESRRQVIYTLTQKGKALIPVLVDLVYWGVKHEGGMNVRNYTGRIEKDRDALIEELVESCP